LAFSLLPSFGGQKTVWEELKEPGTGICYYYSSASQSSQWEPPEWIDYFDHKVLLYASVFGAVSRKLARTNRQQVRTAREMVPLPPPL